MKTYILDTECLSDTEVFNMEYKNMPDYRKDKIDKFKFQKDKKLSLGAGILLNKAMDEANIAIEDRIIKTMENEKPYLAKCPKFKYNISHSQDVAMLVFSDAEVGCDVEQIQDRSFDMKLAKRFFAKEEYDYINSFNDMELAKEAFFKYWTLKESFMKVTGLGMKLALNEFRFVIDKDNIEVFQHINDKKYYFAQGKYKNYIFSICSQSNNIDNNRHIITKLL